MRRVGWVIGGVVVMHLLLLMPLRFSMASMPQTMPTTSVTVRLIRPAEAAPIGVVKAELVDPQPATPEPAVAQPARPATPAARVATASDARSTRATPSTLPRAAVAAAPDAPVTSPASAPAKPAPGLPPAPDYLAVARLDPGPTPLGEIQPTYPERAGQQQGSVVLRLLINERGVVDNVAVVRSAPAGYFEEAALEAFGKALFSPGKLLGVPVKSQITIEVEFMPINRGAAVSGRTY
jgi:protein TonB